MENCSTGGQTRGHLIWLDRASTGKSTYKFAIFHDKFWLLMGSLETSKLLQYLWI